MKLQLVTLGTPSPREEETLFVSSHCKYVSQTKVMLYFGQVTSADDDIAVKPVRMVRMSVDGWKGGRHVT